MKPYLRMEFRSIMFVILFAIAGVNIACVVVTNPEPRIFWSMMINVFICVITGTALGIDIYKIRKKEEKERGEA